MKEPAVSDDVPSITGFRSRIRSLMEKSGCGRAQSVVVLAVDGISYEVAKAAWTEASISRMRSVFPTTSSTGWLSSLTGATPDDHGVPGVVFKSPDRQMVNVFSHQGSLDIAEVGNVFSDATETGHTPIAILGDLTPYRCAWRDALVRGATTIDGPLFYTAQADLGPQQQRKLLHGAVADALGSHPSPALVWFLIDVDQYIHRHGYDERVAVFLEGVENVAVDLAQRATVVAHADHGLTPTTHDPEIDATISRAQRAAGGELGGAGRTRWLYVPSAERERTTAGLSRSLPTSIRVHSSDELFQRGSRSHRRVGEIILIANGERFITAPNYKFDHGSLTEDELSVPLAEWNA